jgi:hypothetical protein
MLACAFGALWLGTGTAQAAVIKLIGFETRNASEISSLGAGAAVSAVTVRPGSGVRSLNQAATASVLATGLTPALDTLGLRFSFRKPSNPGADQTLVLFTTGATSQWALQLRTDGRLQVQDLATLTFVGPALGGTVLSNATWYTVRLAYDRAAGGVLQVWLDASLEVSITHTAVGTAVDQIRVLAAAAVYNYDDFYLTDTATQPPLGQIVRLAVNGTGYRSDFDTVVGVINRDQNVDDATTPADADYNGHAAATLATDLYALEASPVGAINAVKGMWRMSASAIAVGGTHDYAWRVSGIEGSQAIAGLGAAWTQTEVAWNSPPGVGGSWTQAQVEGLELGARHNGTHAEDTFISWTAAMVDYDASGSGGLAPTCGRAPLKPWYNASWQYRKAILVDHTKVVGDLVDFPVLISRSGDADLAAHARPDGFDILFTDEDGTTKLSHQREAYDGAGNLVAWVKVPFLPTGVDKLLFVYYGNPSAADQQSVNATWTNGYQAVWHLNQSSGAGAYILNSALANFHGTPTGTSFNAAGKIGGARTFSNAAYSYVDIGGSSGVLFHRYPQFAFEFWVYPDYASDVVWEAAGEDQLLYANTGPVRLGRVRRFNYNPANTGELQIDVQFNAAGTTYVADSINRSVWNHIVYTYQGSDYQVFFNGVEVYRDVLPNDRLTNASYVLLGLDNTGGALNGSLDEVRASNAGRSSEWIRTQYANQNAPATFCSVCFEQDFSTTVVRLASFEAAGSDRAVDLTWRTASELDNLGFHLYRSSSETGPWTRLNTSLVPGLGSSPVGASYSWRDSGLVNGTRYFYRLEDVDASSQATSHGPVSAVPLAGAASTPGGEDPTRSAASATRKTTPTPSCPDWVVAAYGSAAGLSAATATLGCTRHGDPEAVSLSVVARDSRQATLELRTGGFYALREASGRVRVFVPGFDYAQDPQAPALPFRRALVDAVVGRRVQLGGVRVLDPVAFPGLVPTALGRAEMQVSRDGTVRAGRRALPESSPRLAAMDLVRLLPSVFQGETKSAVVQISPLRYDARRRQLLLSRRVRVRLLFTGRETAESGRGSLGRHARPQPPVTGELLARLYTKDRGLHAVSFEQLFPGRSQGLVASQLRLERQGEAQGFHLEPAADLFGPGSVLYFHAEASARSTDFSSEVAWELRRARDGIQMPLLTAAATGEAVTTAPTATAAFESNRFYQPGLLEAEDPWLWEALASGTTRVKDFSLTGVALTWPQTAELEVFLQGASESGNPVDHHVSASLNGAPVGEARFAGKQPYRMSLRVPLSLLHEGTNQLSLTNVADTGVSSYVFLDRFTVRYPQGSALAGGLFDGTWSESGTATVSGAAVALLDVTTAPSWLRGYEATGGALRFRAEAGRRYLAVSGQALLAPRVAAPSASTLRSQQNQADYLLIAPQAFLAAAEPLLRRRQAQGFAARAIALEEISDEFGHGQPSAEAIKGFLAYTYLSWARPSPRYVLLLGDSSYDPRNFTGASRPSPLPALWTRTSYLWTASDPELAAVNGDDALPDLAIGRLPATTVGEANGLVQKLLAWEDSGQGLSGAAALVADNPDVAGDFDADVDDIARSFFQGRSVSTLMLSRLGPGMRPAIRDALDSGLGFLSYVGHGGAAVWASENVWNSWDAPSLLAQSRQPLLLTLNCLNGYFVAPTFDSLAESLLKVEGRGAIAAFSPSGLSLDGPAHQYHRALMAELTSGRHERLGDALLAAQKDYATSGAFPELLSVYHLFGDPGLRIR